MRAELEAIIKNWKPRSIATRHGQREAQASDMRRLLEKVAIGEDGCWRTTGSVTGKGYARFRFDGRSGHGHRFAYLALVGPIPDGLELDHVCRVRHCVNPAHLEPVTHLENLKRRKPSEEWARSQPTHCVNDHEYTRDNTYNRPNGKRDCRICKNAEKARYRARKAAARKDDAR